jgi:uncharacterized membrane protein YkvA (DUF1232 family)
MVRVRELVLSLVGGLLLLWLLLVVALLVAGPRGGALRESVRLLPDLLRLVGRLAKDPTLPRGVRWRVAGLLAYLALPVDLVPDFVPVVGYADDAVAVVLVLRSVVRKVGLEPLRQRWPGTPEGFDALCRVTGIGPSGRS